MKQSNNETVKQKGFTLLELFVSIFIIIVGVVGILNALLASVSVTFVSSSRLTAAYLAQEGIEIVRNLRETNWLKIHKGGSENWDDNIFCCQAPPYNCVGVCSCECEADYLASTLTDWADQYLYIDGTTRFYRYIAFPVVSDIRTEFKRKIIVDKLAVDEIRVSVYIFWQERGRNFQLAVREKLYDWK